MITVRIRWRWLVAITLGCAVAIAGTVWGSSRAHIARDYSATVLILEDCLERAVDHARRAAAEPDAAIRRELTASMLGAAQAGSRLALILNCYDRADPELAGACSRVATALVMFPVDPPTQELLDRADLFEAVLMAIRGATTGDKVNAGKLMRALRGLTFD